MELFDRPWIRELRRRILAEVKASPPLTKRLRQRAKPGSRIYSVEDLAIFRFLGPIVWFLLALGHDGKYTMGLFPYWAAVLIVLQWAAFCALPDRLAAVMALPLDPAQYLAHLWKRQAIPVVLLGLEAWIVFAMGGCGTREAGLTSALFALPAAAAVSGGGLAVSLFLARWVSLTPRAAASFVAIVGLVWIQQANGKKTFQWISSALEAPLGWATPAGWTVQGVNAFAHQEWWLALAFTGAVVAIIGTVPGNLTRLYHHILVAADAKVAKALSGRRDEKPEPEAACALLAPSEEKIRDGETIAREWFAGPGQTIPEPGNPALRRLHRQLDARGRLILQCLIGPNERDTAPFATVIKQSLLLLGALFLVRHLDSKLALQAYFMGIVILSFQLISTFGLRAAVLEETFCRSRFLPAYGGLPIGDDEVRRIMGRANSANLLVSGPVVVLAIALGGVIVGHAFFPGLGRAAVGLLILWLAQPILLTVRFLNSPKAKATSVITSWLPMVVGFLLAIEGAVWAMFSFSVLEEGLQRMWPVLGWLASYGALWGTAWWYRRHHAQGRVDLAR